MSEPIQPAPDIVEKVARAMYPDLFSDDATVRHRAASPHTITHAQDVARRHVREFLSTAEPLIRADERAKLVAWLRGGVGRCLRKPI
jgi:hypothetical protein